MSEQKDREPLVYIRQPGFLGPTGQMQETFSIKEAEKRREKMKQERKKEQEAVAQSEKVEKNKKQLNLSSEDVQKKIQEYEKDAQEEDVGYREYGLRPLKSFRDMTVLEKIQYLHEFPKQLPPVPCYFKTNNREIKGVLVDSSEHEITVMTMDQSKITLRTKELVSLRMLGFQS